MNKIILSVGADDNYIQNHRLINYLNSIIENSNFDMNVLVYLGTKDIVSYNEKINIFNVYPDSVKKMNENRCLQHGEFLNSDKFSTVSDSDIIVFTDGDMTLQRKLTNEEISFYRNLNDNDVYVGYNQSPNDTIFDEYFRLSPINPDPTTLFQEDLKSIKVYNTGVLCMNKKTWNKLKNLYIEKFDKINNIFRHYAKQQWLISYILGTENFNIIEMGYDIHNHTHYPSPVGTTNQNGLVKYYDKVVLFKHRWF